MMGSLSDDRFGIFRHNVIFDVAELFDFDADLVAGSQIHRRLLRHAHARRRARENNVTDIKRERL